MTPAAYPPARARQLRNLLRVVVVMAALMVAYALVLLAVSTAAPGLVLLLLVLPAVVLLGLARQSLGVLAGERASARWWCAGTGLAMVATGLLLSRVPPGFLLLLVGVLLLLVALLPGRDDEDAPGTDRLPR